MHTHLARPADALLVAVAQLPTEAVSPGEERSRGDHSCAMVRTTRHLHAMQIYTDRTHMRNQSEKTD